MKTPYGTLQSQEISPATWALSDPGTSSKRYDRADETTHSTCIQAGLAITE
jgi:hypothetical protein